MRVLETPARLAHWGVPYRLVAGWEGRGNEFPVRPDGALRHWTGVGGEALNAIINGRPDLTGPLAQLYQSRQVDPATGLDIVYVVASGKANHAGAGVLNGIEGNYKLLGLEIGWAGAGEAFPPMRQLTSELAMRALLDCCLGDDPNDVGEHREYARPVGRKQDTNLSGDELRRRMTTITPYTTGDLDLMASQFDQIMGELKTLTGELFHYGEVKEPVLETGQRKTQFWRLMANGPKANSTDMYAGGTHKMVAALIVRQDPELAAALGLTMPADIGAKLPPPS